MKWQGREQSSNVEDRRGQGGGGGGFGGGSGGFGGGLGPLGGGRIPMGRAGGGGLGLVGIIVVLGIIWFVTGQNPIDVLTGGGTTTSSQSSSQWTPSRNADSDELASFVGVVLKDTETFWTKEFQDRGAGRYVPPKLVIYDNQTPSSCGTADRSAGPFYCPNDKKVYIDLSFYQQLRDQFGAAGDFAQAYVVAHEIGHAVQDQTGILPEFNRKRASMSQDQQNAYSVRVELQADCYAGVWANYENKAGYLDQGDAAEAINAANSIGDDTLTHGQVSSRNFTHGTSAQRMKWLKRGIDSGDVAQCDTFSGSI